MVCKHCGYACQIAERSPRGPVSRNVLFNCAVYFGGTIVRRGQKLDHKMVDELGKDFEGSAHDLIEVVAKICQEGLRRTTENLSIVRFEPSTP
jgi:hypothetical protein